MELDLILFSSLSVYMCVYREGEDIVVYTVVRDTREIRFQPRTKWIFNGCCLCPATTWAARDKRALCACAERYRGAGLSRE